MSLNTPLSIADVLPAPVADVFIKLFINPSIGVPLKISKNSFAVPTVFLLSIASSGALSKRVSANKSNDVKCAAVLLASVTIFCNARTALSAPVSVLFTKFIVLVVIPSIVLPTPPYPSIKALNKSGDALTNLSNLSLASAYFISAVNTPSVAASKLS